ncbi:hypothetical protein GOV09_05870 [Candidatus Woesearchaeota archaeon]|nr:hypothetical protein [Candidatus Woesearchaeota archaeon]
MITEGKATLAVKTQKIVSKEMNVFYNPVMAFNRDISILLLNALKKKDFQIGLPLAGSGIRGIRFLREVKGIKNIWFNDHDKKATLSIKKNLKLNNIKAKFSISNEDANLFLLKSAGFDYIDIDPFGSPNAFLDSSVRRISRNGILGITATDTSALCGTYVKACRRKYWANPLRNETMHEIGIRILIRKVQLIGAQYEKALIPILSYSKDHYMRVFFLCEKGKSKVDPVLKQHDMFGESGPLWEGKLWDEKLVRKMHKISPSRFLKTILDESKIHTIGFYHLPSVAKRHKLGSLPRQDAVMKAIKKKGHKVSETHFMENSIRSTVAEKDLVRIIKAIR